MKTVIGIDVGGSTTKIVGAKKCSDGSISLIEPLFVKATDAITSAYGAFGKFTMQNSIGLDEINLYIRSRVKRSPSSPRWRLADSTSLDSMRR